MGFLDTRNKRKSAGITSLIMSLLFVAIFLFGLKYLDPPEEYGIAVNFGTSDVGQGTVQPAAPLKSAAQPEEVKEQELKEQPEELVTPVEEKVDKVVEETAKNEEVLTQESEEAIAIKKAEEEQKKKEAADRKKEAERLERERLEAERKERERQAEIARKKAEEDAKKAKLDAMIGGINNASGTEEGGEGNDNTAGDKGKITGDPNASGYYGNGGSGGDGDYNLGNRKPLSRPKPDYICNEEGLVVVSIEVDRSGRVIKAKAGAKGTTTSATCLWTQAESAAKKTTWNPDSNAPSKQLGTIKYRFSLSQ